MAFWSSQFKCVPDLRRHLTTGINTNCKYYSPKIPQEQTMGLLMHAKMDDPIPAFGEKLLYVRAPVYSRSNLAVSVTALLLSIVSCFLDKEIV